MQRDYLKYLIGSKGALREIFEQDKIRELPLQLLACIYRGVANVNMPTAKELAKTLTYHQNLVYKHLTDLEDEGYIEAFGGGKNTGKDALRKNIQGFDPVLYTITSKGVRTIEKYEALIEKYGK